MSILIAIALTLAVLAAWRAAEIYFRAGRVVAGVMGALTMGGSLRYSKRVYDSRLQELLVHGRFWTVTALLRAPFIAGIAAIWIWVA